MPIIHISESSKGQVQEEELDFCRATGEQILTSQGSAGFGKTTTLSADPGLGIVLKFIQGEGHGLTRVYLNGESRPSLAYESSNPE